MASSGTTITRAEWNFGNGATASTTSPETAYSYPAVGTFEARVTVTASDGRTGSAAQTVTIQRRQTAPPPAPTPTPQPNTSGYGASIACTEKPAGSVTPCQATVTYNGAVQPSSTVTEVHWDFGDGATFFTTAPVASHIYAGAGGYTVFADVYASTPAGPTNQVVSTVITIP